MSKHEGIPETKIKSTTDDAESDIHSLYIKRPRNLRKLSILSPMKNSSGQAVTIDSPSTSSKMINSISSSARPESPALDEEEIDRECNFRKAKTRTGLYVCTSATPESEEVAALEEAAFQSRLPPEKLSTKEANAFPDVVQGSTPTQKLFLYLRNRILQLWLANPREELMLGEVLDKLEPPYDSDRTLCKRVYEFLNRHGLINFGVFFHKEAIVPKTGSKVIVIGAGIAGIAAAQQLTRFGFEVVILESRDRVGGRIVTFRKQNYIADLGAMVVTGLGGNPLTVLSKQIRMDLYKIKQKCPLYEVNGETVPKQKDEKIEREFNKLLEATSYLSHHLDFNYVNNKAVSLGQALEWVIKLQEKCVKEKHLEHLNKLQEILEEQKDTVSRLHIVREEVEELSKKYHTILDGTGNARNITQEFARRATSDELWEAIKKYEKLNEELKKLQRMQEDLENDPPDELYLSTRDRLILDWHFANLEFANAAPLSHLSLKHWDQDDDYEFTGSHLTKITVESMS